MPLPNFLVVGPPRAGTTSLNSYLQQHPDIFMSPVKEPHYFDFMNGMPELHGNPTPAIRDWWDSRVLTPEAYRRLFDGVRAETTIGEATPNYLGTPECPERIRALIPETRLVAVLRDPVDRAYSHFCHNRRCGLEPCGDFAEALADEPRRITRNWDLGWCYMRAGRYEEQLQRYLKVFSSEQVGVFLYDDLRADPVACVRNIFRFLGVDAGFLPDCSERKLPNVGVPVPALVQRTWQRLPSAVRTRIEHRLPRRGTSWLRDVPYVRTAIDPGLRAKLVSDCGESIRRLESLTGRKLAAWREPQS